MGLVKKSNYLYAKLLDKTQEVDEQLIELDDKEIIRLDLESYDILTVSIDHIEWANTESLETYQGTKATLPKINIYWDDETITQASISSAMLDNPSYYTEAGTYELHAVYRNFTSTNTITVTVIEKVLVSIEWENNNPITTQQNHRAYLPYIKLNYNDGKFKRLSNQSPGVALSDSEYYLELGEKTLTATYKGFTTNELTINVIEEEIIDENTHDYSQDPLTFECLEDGYFNVTLDVKYSIDNGETWNLLNIGQNSILIYANTKVQFKRNSQIPDLTGIQIKFTKKCNVYGQLNSINGYSKSLSREAFKLCFSGNKIIHSKHLILPSSSNYYSYSYLFQNCNLMIDFPNIFNITYLSQSCFSGMFAGCSSLIEAPELPWMTLADDCFSGMFAGCSSLIEAPELPAEILKPFCYNNMFQGCTSLTGAPKLNSIYLSSNCYSGMFSGCTSLIAAPELPALQLADYCYSDMFSGCTSLIAAPELPATILTTQCYQNMFSGCTSLITAP